MINYHDDISDMPCETCMESPCQCEKPKQNPIELIKSFIGQRNLVELIDAEMVRSIGLEAVRGFEVDKASRTDWEKSATTALNSAMQVIEEKSWPWPKAANVKYPLITTAAIQFSARAYPSIIQGSDVVKGEVIGPDDDGMKKARAERIGRHMSFQVLEEIPGWDEEMDRLLFQIAIIGCSFKKTYFDTMLGIPRSDMLSAMDVVYDHSTQWDKLRRITHCLNLYKNEIVERVRNGVFTEIELGAPEGTDNDEDGQFEFLECHCWYDIDGDGYKEPYIVTVKKDSAEVVRIFPRFDEDGIYVNDQMEISKIIPVEYFTKFAFMPNPDGGSYDIGLGALLGSLSASIDTILNQLLDAGTQNIVGGGFIGSGLRLKGGSVRFAPGEFKPVDVSGGKIADNIYHMQFPGPNATLFQLLGMLIEAGKDISSVKDILTGETGVNQTATATLALIEQGQKVFSAIYKRVHRSLKQEFQKIYRLNRLYLQPEDYYKFQDKVEKIYLEDYQGDNTNVTPVSDPSLVSDAQILTRAEALMRFIGDPLFNQVELRKKYLKAIKETDENLVLDKPDETPQLQQKLQEMQAAMQEMQQKLSIAESGQAKTQAEIAARSAEKDKDIAFERDKIIIGATLEKEKVSIDTAAKIKIEQDKIESAEEIAELRAYVDLSKAGMANSDLSNVVNQDLKEEGAENADREISGVEGSPADQGVSSVPA